MKKKVAKVIAVLVVIVLASTGVVALVNTVETYVTKVTNTFRLYGETINRIGAVVQLHEDYLQTERNYKKYVDKRVNEMKAVQK